LKEERRKPWETTGGNVPEQRAAPGGGASLAEALGVIKKKETERNTSLF
jgi:hypothetical protein